MLLCHCIHDQYNAAQFNQLFSRGKTMNIDQMNRKASKCDQGSTLRGLTHLCIKSRIVFVETTVEVILILTNEMHWLHHLVWLMMSRKIVFCTSTAKKFRNVCSYHQQHGRPKDVTNSVVRMRWISRADFQNGGCSQMAGISSCLHSKWMVRSLHKFCEGRQRGLLKSFCSFVV